MRVIRYWLAAVFVVVSASILGQAAQAQTPPSAFELMQPSEVTGLQVSLSGRYTAYIQARSKKYCISRHGAMMDESIANCKDKDRQYRTIHLLSIFDIEKAEDKLNTTIPGNLLINWVKWISDDRILVSIVRPTTVGDNDHSYILGGARILSLPIDGTKGTFLFENQERMNNQNQDLSTITNILRDDPEHIIMPARYKRDLNLYKVNLMTGRPTLVEEGKNNTYFWYTDNDGKPILRFDCATSGCYNVEVYARVNVTDPWRKITTIKVRPEDDTVDLDFVPVAPTSNPNQLYVISDEDGVDHRAVRIYDYQSGTYVRTVYENPNFDVGNVLLDTETGEYAGVSYVDDRLKYEFKDKTFDRHFAAINRVFKDQKNVRLLGQNKSGSKVIVQATSVNNPGEYGIYDTASGQYQTLIGKKPKVTAALKSVKADILKVQTRDGKSIAAYHSYKNGINLAAAPLIVMPHGGPERRDFYDYDPQVLYFTSRGYQVLQVNFRGSSGYGKAFAEAGHGEWGGVMQNDVTDAVKFLHSSGKGTAENTCIVGYSYGGYVALYGAATTPELYKCVVSGGGVSDLLLSLKNTRKEDGKNSKAYEYWLESMGDPDQDEAKLASRSPVNMAEKFQAPVLLIHGEDDYIVDVEHSEDMAKALKKAGKDVTFHEMKGEAHNYWLLENEIWYLQTIEAFLRKHIAAPPQ